MAEIDFEQMLAREIKRTNERTHINAKDLAIRSIFPLLRHLYGAISEDLDELASEIGDLQDTLGLAEDKDFMRFTFEMITQQQSFIDELLVAAGYFRPREDGIGYLVTEAMPKDMIVRIQDFQARGQQWFAQYEQLLAVHEGGGEGEEAEIYYAEIEDGFAIMRDGEQIEVVGTEKEAQARLEELESEELESEEGTDPNGNGVTPESPAPEVILDPPTDEVSHA